MEGQRSIHRRVRLLEEARNGGTGLAALEDRVADMGESLSRLRRNVAASQLLDPVGDEIRGRVRELE